jgi:hypothetical protein
MTQPLDGPPLPDAARQPGCRVEVRTLSPDPERPSGGQLVASAEPSGDGRWHMHHRDGRHVVVGTTTEVVERMIGVACDVSLAERWRTLAVLASSLRPERAATLRFCAAELVPSADPLADGGVHRPGGDVLAAVAPGATAVAPGMAPAAAAGAMPAPMPAD